MPRLFEPEKPITTAPRALTPEGLDAAHDEGFRAGREQERERARIDREREEDRRYGAERLAERMPESVRALGAEHRPLSHDELDAVARALTDEDPAPALDGPTARRLIVTLSAAHDYALATRAALDERTAERDAARATLGRTRDAAREASRALTGIATTEIPDGPDQAASGPLDDALAAEARAAEWIEELPAELATMRTAFAQALARAYRKPPTTRIGDTDDKTLHHSHEDGRRCYLQDAPWDCGGKRA